jgi:hypothetical protein
LKEAVLANRTIDIVEGFDFLPENLVRQCLDLVEKCHAVQGYRCLPDMLWRSGLGPMIEHNRSFKKLLDKASRSRSAKIANENFVRITTTILALEILASSFVGWSSLFPEAANKARDFLKRNSVGRHTPLMDRYVYPPMHINPNAIATLTPNLDGR